MERGAIISLLNKPHAICVGHGSDHCRQTDRPAKLSWFPLLREIKGRYLGASPRGAVDLSGFTTRFCMKSPSSQTTMGSVLVHHMDQFYILLCAEWMVLCCWKPGTRVRPCYIFFFL